jgi:hypothetical protein
MNNILIFTAALVIPFVVIRTAFLIIPHYLDFTHPTTSQGLKFHHFHYGFFVIFAGILVLLIQGQISTLSLWLLGIGSGLVLDEITASLLIPEQEPVDTRIYSHSLVPTFALIVIMVGILVTISRFLP